MASALSGAPASIVSADVALGSDEPIVGSFTADGLTYAVGPDGLTLVAADPAAVLDGALGVPATVAYEGVGYPVTAIGPYAFYLSGATDVALPASIASVDDRAFRSCDVERVEVDSDNPHLASSDGCLYDSQLLRLLLIPGGRKGAVRIPDKAEGVDAPAFSHCAGVDAISVDAGSAHLSSWDGLLYDADGTTLLRVPAGATDITIRDGCTTIASGAMAGCANLERINAPATVASISPDAFEDVPIVALPAQSALQAEASSGVASSLLDQAKEPTGSAPQLTAMVALSSSDDDLPEADPAAITVSLAPGSANETIWRNAGFAVLTADAPVASLQEGGIFYGANNLQVRARQDGKGGHLHNTVQTSNASQLGDFWVCSINTDYKNLKIVLSSANFAMTVNETTYKANGYAVAAPGYTFKGWNLDGSNKVAFTSKTLSQASGTLIVYTVFHPNQYTVTLNPNGGTGGTGSAKATFDAAMPTTGLKAPTRNGYAFSGYWRDPVKEEDGSCYYSAAEDGTLKSEKTYDIVGTTTLYAHWLPVVAADVPLEVTAKVDLLGIEEQTEAPGYIESRCGESLEVAQVDFKALAGAAELFDSQASQVFLEASVAGGEGQWWADQPVLRFPLRGTGGAHGGDSDRLAAFDMASYGDRVPISYRFIIPDDALAAIDPDAFSEATTPVCQVVYTVALA